MGRRTANRLTWPEWRELVRNAYKGPCWPNTTMRRYYDAGLSPILALDLAHGKRIRLGIIKKVRHAH